MTLDIGGVTRRSTFMPIYPTSSRTAPWAGLRGCLPAQPVRSPRLGLRRSLTPVKLTPVVAKLATNCSWPGPAATMPTPWSRQRPRRPRQCCSHTRFALTQLLGFQNVGNYGGTTMVPEPSGAASSERPSKNSRGPCAPGDGALPTAKRLPS